jgi:hypothetical protein
LIDRATDRFDLTIGIRAWYQPDPGSTSLPAFIHGTVSATYRFADIDPKCFGWSSGASKYLWIRVVEDSVRFDGTAEEDLRRLVPVLHPLDQAAVNAQITAQIAGLLATEFEPSPHPVSERFRRGSMISVVDGGSAVAVPVGLDGGPPRGDVASILIEFAGDSDFALAVSSDYIMSQVDQPLADLRSAQIVFGHQTQLVGWNRHSVVHGPD